MVGVGVPPTHPRRFPNRRYNGGCPIRRSACAAGSLSRRGPGRGVHAQGLAGLGATSRRGGASAYTQRRIRWASGLPCVTHHLPCVGHRVWCGMVGVGAPPTHPRRFANRRYNGGCPIRRSACAAGSLSRRGPGRGAHAQGLAGLWGDQPGGRGSPGGGVVGRRRTRNAGYAGPAGLPCVTHHLPMRRPPGLVRMVGVGVPPTHPRRFANRRYNGGCPIRQSRQRRSGDPMRLRHSGS